MGGAGTRRCFNAGLKYESQLARDRAPCQAEMAKPGNIARNINRETKVCFQTVVKFALKSESHPR
jgi:hypothetical protein